MQNAGLEADIFEVMGQSQASQDQDHLRKNLKNLPAPRSTTDRTTSTERDSLSFL